MKIRPRRTQRAKQLEVQHGDLRTVQSLLRVETETSDVQVEGKTDNNSTKHVSTDQAKLIETLEREISHLQGEISFLRARVEELTPLALPRPRRGLFAWLRGQRFTRTVKLSRFMSPSFDCPSSLDTKRFCQFVVCALAIRYGGFGCSQPSVAPRRMISPI